jgi:hypothetical protein
MHVIRPRSRAFAWAVAVAAIAAATPPAARAAVVGIDVTPIGGINGGIAFGTRTLVADWPIAGAGGLWIYNDLGGELSIGGFDGLEFAIGSPVTYANPRNYSQGTSIDASATWTSGTAFTAFKYFGSLSSDFNAGDSMGFRFGSGSTWRYGYVEVIWSFTAGVFSIRSAAYETTVNTAILAGAPPTPIPAPSALALLALGGGAFRRARARGSRFGPSG